MKKYGATSVIHISLESKIYNQKFYKIIETIKKIFKYFVLKERKREFLNY